MIVSSEPAARSIQLLIKKRADILDIYLYTNEKSANLYSAE